MNELLELFVSETRELLEAASKDLLALEKDPADHECLNRLFRSTHTLKSSAAMFDYDPMTALMHAAEDLLDALRQGKLTLNAATVDQLLDCLDMVSQWVEHVEAHESLTADAEAVSKELIEGLRTLVPDELVPADSPLAEVQAPADLPAPGPAVLAGQPVLEWLEVFSETERAAIERAGEDTPLTVVRYTPDPRCFFAGDDPFALMRGLPELLALHMEPVEPWPDLDDLDPYNCQLRFTAVSATALTAVREYLHALRNQVEVEVISPAEEESTAEQSSAGPVDKIEATSVPQKEDIEDEEQRAFEHVIQAQIELLGQSGEPGLWQGIVDAAAKAACNCLACVGRSAEIPRIEEALSHTVEQHNNKPLIEALQGLAAGAPAAAPETPALPAVSAEPPEAGKAGLSKTLKIDQARIDKLMDLIGELIVAKNALPYLAQRADQVFGVAELAREIKDRHSAIEHIAESLQHAIMQVRMLPVSQILQRMPRLVRDLAHDLGKQAEVVMEGEETEADKNVIELLSEPLLHLVRNSVGHGLESPAERRAHGKRETGRVLIRAWQESDRVCLEVRDDGRGIDPAKIRERIRTMQLVAEDKLVAMSDQEVIQYTFAAGLSTAAEISGLSGRGVGMDVVHSTVEQLGGSVTLHSELGQGTRITLALPLSAAVSRIMAFEVRGQKFALPIVNVVETMRLPLDRVSHIKHSATFLWRERTVPLVSLAERLQLGDDDEARDGEAAVLMIKHHGGHVGLRIGRFLGGMDVILKPLEGVLAELRGHYAGTALLGDGSVLLVLNLRELL